jgi:hypothetical protein
MNKLKQSIQNQEIAAKTDVMTAADFKEEIQFANQEQLSRTIATTG